MSHVRPSALGSFLGGLGSVAHQSELVMVATPPTDTDRVRNFLRDVASTRTAADEGWLTVKAIAGAVGLTSSRVNGCVHAMAKRGDIETLHPRVRGRFNNQAYRWKVRT